MLRAMAAVLCLALSAPAFALTPQQQRMKDCNAKATGMKGETRKEFMAKCLKGEDATATPPAASSQNQKMKDCNANATAKGLKGDARKAFMKDCLKG